MKPINSEHLNLQFPPGDDDYESISLLSSYFGVGSDVISNSSLSNSKTRTNSRI